MSYTNYQNLSTRSNKLLGSLREKADHKPQRYSPYGSGPPYKQGTIPTIFVGNLAPDITEDILFDVFKDCGEIKEVRLKRHSDTGKLKGFGFIDFYLMSCAYGAIEEKNGVVVLGRPLLVELSLSRQQERSDDKRGTGIKQPLPPIKPELDQQKVDLNLLSQLRQSTQILNPNYQIPVYHQYPTTNPPHYDHTTYNPLRGDSTINTEYISKRSTDRVEQPQRERPPGCTTVFIGNLLNDVREEDIREVFKDCSIKEVRWLFDSKSGTKKFKGCGFVDFNDEESTIKAARLNGRLVLGRPMRVDYASDSKKSQKFKPTQGTSDRSTVTTQYMAQNPYRTQANQGVTQPYTAPIYTDLGYQNLPQTYIPSAPVQIPSTNQPISQQNIPQTQSSQSPLQGNQPYPPPPNQSYYP